MKEFNKYIVLKGKFKSKYRGHELSNLLSFQIASFSYGILKTPKITFKKIFKNFLNVRRLSGLEEVLCCDGFIFSHANLIRNDYIEFVDKSAGFLTNSKTFRYSFKNYAHRNFFLILNSIFQSFKFLGKDYTIKDKLFWAYYILEVKLNINYIESLAETTKVKGFFAFNSSVNQDSILCSVFNKYNIPTYSLQHGFYLNYKKNIPIDVINYENITANRLLCWGKSTVENLLEYGIKKEKLLIIGNPRATKLDVVDLKKPDFSKILILLGRYIHHSSNMKLLELLEELVSQSKVDVYLKLHPSLEQMNLEKYYSSRFKIIPTSNNLTDVLEKFDFAISNNTSAYFDAKINGILCFRFGKYENENFRENEYVFNSLDEYYFLKNIFLNMPYELLNKKLKKSIEYHFAKDVSLNFLKLSNERMF